MSRRDDLIRELRLLVRGRRIVDAIAPPLVFVAFNSLFGLIAGVAAGVGSAVLLAGRRLARRQPIGEAVGGIGAVALAAAVAMWLGRAEGYFLPGIATSAGYALLGLASIVAGRPFVAWTSWVVRRFPLAWYWHPQVRPAYTEVSWLWVGFFAGRAALQYRLFAAEEVAALAAVRLVTGWPALIALLAASYLYGVWRLDRLAGPTVDEFRAGRPPPWQGGQKAF